MRSFRNAARLLGAVFQETLDALAGVFFPAPCRLCEATLVTASRIPICPACLASFRPLPEPQCGKCGRPFVSLVAATAARPQCHACRRGAYAFDVARAFAPYDEAMVRAILLLKYQAVTPLGGWFAARLAELIARQPELQAADAVVPVPLHPLRLRERGHNQAELIARPLARRLGLPLRPLLLVRTRPRPDKLRLSRRERWSTVRGAFAIRPGSQVDKLRVLLVDDVFTTGATLDACARALHQGGAARVAGVTVARVLPGWVNGLTAAEGGSWTR